MLTVLLAVVLLLGSPPEPTSGPTTLTQLRPPTTALGDAALPLRARAEAAVGAVHAPSGNGAGVGCTEDCIFLTDPQTGAIKGFGCQIGTQGDDCRATRSGCGINEIGCGPPDDPEGEVDFLVGSEDGVSLYAVKFCWKARATIAEHRVGFAREVQWDAVAFNAAHAAP